MLTLYFDGLFRPLDESNTLKGRIPGIMCYGWLIFRDDVEIAHGFGGCIDVRGANSNVAEFLALIDGLEALDDMGANRKRIKIIGDARTVIDQMCGVSAVNASSIMRYYRRARRLARRFPHLEWEWTPRRCNRAADHLTRRALQRIHEDRANLDDLIVELRSKRGGNTRRERLSNLLDLRIYQPVRLAPGG